MRSRQPNSRRSLKDRCRMTARPLKGQSARPSREEAANRKEEVVFSVEISRSNESAVLAESMTKMREWLDERRVEPAVFRCNTTPRAVVFRIEFADEDQAVAFAEAFSGHLVGQIS